MFIGGSEKRLRRHQIGRAVVDIDGCPELCHPALVQRRRIPAKQQRLVRFGRGIDEDRTGFREDARQFSAQFLAQFVVEIGERLVEQHQFGVLHESPRKRRALLLPAGEI